MPTTFRRHELPIAFAMIETAERVKPRRDGRDPYDRYFLLWTAFSHIYQTIAARAGLQSRLVTDEEGRVVTRKNGSVHIPVVRPASEQELVGYAAAELPETVRQQLITHPATKYFAERTPFWEGQKIEHDALGQALNGVIHIRHTTGAEYPVWSPIDTPLFENYLPDQENDAQGDFLITQVLDLLLTIRENLVQFNQKFDDSNDRSVIENGLALLEIIVAAFTR